MINHTNRDTSKLALLEEKKFSLEILISHLLVPGRGGWIFGERNYTAIGITPPSLASLMEILCTPISAFNTDLRQSAIDRAMHTQPINIGNTNPE